MTMNSKALFFLSFCLFLFLPLSAQAAELFFGAHERDIGVGRKFELGVFLNSQNESLNTVQGTIAFPADRVVLHEIQTGGSLLALWIKQPAVTYNGATGEISFTGLIPGGFEGNEGYLFSLIAEAKKPGPLTITTQNEKILHNDAQGSEAVVQRAPLTITATEKAKDTFKLEILPDPDTSPPEPFTPTVHQDPNLFEGKWFVIFTTDDGASGINNYEMQESKDGSIEAKNWKTVESPAVLQDQARKSYIYVKAIDRAGNERLAQIAPAPKESKGYENYVIWGIIIVIGVLGLFLAWKKFRPKPPQPSEPMDLQS